MNYEIKRIVKGDLPAIAQLHHNIFGSDSEEYKDPEMLEWLFKDPFDDRQYNGFVAKNMDGEVLGMIGYAINDYKIGNRVQKGVIPMSWLVAPEVRGILGIRLLLAVAALGDFIFAMGGTTMAIKAYGPLKLIPVGHAEVFTKVFNVFRFIAYRGSFSSAEIIKSILFFRRKRRKFQEGSIKLQPFRNGSDHLTGSYDELAILPTTERNRWIMDCPVVESHAFGLEYNDQFMGNCICYIREGCRNVKRGRIVLLPYAGKNPDFYRKAILLMERYLVDKGCCSVSIVSMHSTMMKALKACGYRHFPKLQGYPVFVRFKHNNFQNSNLSDWFLSYYESDKGHLHF